MNIYMAPLEGITGHIYRNVFHNNFSGVDKFFTPFISPNKTKGFKQKEIKDILPENNKGMDVVPQILTNSSKDFLRTVQFLKEYGYREVNLNLGCPSGTVVSKNKGAGFLQVPEELDKFFYEIFEGCQDVAFSVKTRIGMETPEEFPDILEVYKKYPFTEIIIHPRVRTEFYNGKPHMDVFDAAKENTNIPLVYNGNLFTLKNLYEFAENHNDEKQVMIGRGLIANPALAEIYKGEEKADKAKFKKFHDELLEAYICEMSGDANAMYKCKEMWFYMKHSFTEFEKYGKKIKKANSIESYKVAVNSLFANEDMVLPESMIFTGKAF